MEETIQMKELQNKHWDVIQLEFPEVTECNVGANINEDGGQSVPHVHFHIIPRRKDDVENPRGGIRGVIPGKQSY